MPLDEVASQHLPACFGVSTELRGISALRTFDGSVEAMKPDVE
jgi:hypothetical protein